MSFRIIHGIILKLKKYQKMALEFSGHFCKKYIHAEMEEFVENYIKQFDQYTEVPVHFVGSIAFYLRDELNEVLTNHGIKLGNVLRRPIDGLIAYHVLNK